MIAPFKTHRADLKIEEDRGKIQEDRGESRKIEEDRGRPRERGEIEEDQGKLRKIKEDRRKIEERSMKIEGSRGNCVFLGEPFLGSFRDAGVLMNFWADGLCGWNLLWGRLRL